MKVMISTKVTIVRLTKSYLAACFFFCSAASFSSKGLENYRAIFSKHVVFGKHDDDHYLGKLIAQKPGNLSQRGLFCFSLSLRVRLEKRGEQQGGGGKEGTGGRSCKKHIFKE